jgi:hypothetical protein
MYPANFLPFFFNDNFALLIACLVSLVMLVGSGCALPAGNKINLPELPQIVKNYFQLFTKS